MADEASWSIRAWRLGTTVARNEIWLYRRNPLEAWGTIILVGALLSGVFFAARAFIPGLSRSATGQSSWIVASIVLVLVTQGYQRIAMSLQDQASKGTLEQSAMCPLGLPAVAVVSFIAWLVTGLVPMAPLAVLLMAASGRWIESDPLTIAVLVACLLAVVLGLGLILGGLGLVFKRMTIINGMIVLPILLVISLPVDHLPGLAFLPLALPNTMLERAAGLGTHLWGEPPWQLAVLALTTAAYLGIGLIVFRWMDRIARRRGALGQY